MRKHNSTVGAHCSTKIFISKLKNILFQERQFDDEQEGEGPQLIEEYKQTYDTFFKFFREFYVEAFGFKYR